MPIVSNSIQNNTNGSSTSIPSRSRTYRSGGKAISLQEGQTLKGVVSDIHGNEITLSMEDGSSFTGKLPDANQYSIGQKAAFQITTLESNTIYMKAITSAYLLDIEDTIEQALEEANLPKTPRNLDVVRSLLQNQQSISQDNILASIRLCAQYPDADVNTVISMNRLNIPLTESAVRQFESYQNQTHQLLGQMNTLTDSIGDMLGSIGEQVPRIAKEIGTSLLGIALEGSPNLEETILSQSNTQTAESTIPIAYDENGDPISSTFDENGNIISSGFDENGNPISSVFDENGSPINSTSVESLNDHVADSISKEEPTGPFARMRQLLSSIADGTSAAKNAVAESGLAEDFRTPFIHEQSGFVLSPAERESFASLLTDYPISDEMQEGIRNGTITTRDFLTEIKQAFPNMTDEQAGRILASKEFQAFVKEQFLSGWTVSPERLKQDGALDEIYDKMSRQFETLSKFSEQVLGKDVFSQVTNTATHMNENLDFMKTLNQTFQYIQLPIKMQNQNTHGDLYVMTRKSALKKDPNNLKVLLHLDLDHLGTLDIQIAKEHTSVSTKFFVSSQNTKALLEKNIELLSHAINEQGYAFSSELSLKEKNIDIVNDFIAAEAPVGDLKRYNFDLRA